MEMIYIIPLLVVTVCILFDAALIFILTRKKLGKKRFFALIPLVLFIIFQIFFFLFAWGTSYDNEAFPIDENFTYWTEQREIDKAGEDIGIGGVPPTINFYVNDDSFVLAKQKPKLGHYEGYPDKDWLECEYFWIIDLKQVEVLGPLTEDGFNEELARLNVPEKLIREFQEKQETSQ